MLRTLIAVAALLIATQATAAEVPGPLVGPGWVAENRDAVTVLDVRGNPDAFAAKGHIPGAALVPWDDVRAEVERDGQALTRMRPRAEDFQERMRGWGVDSGEAVVITSPGKGLGHLAHSTRLYWQVKYFGHDNVAILDGGNAAWVAADKDLRQGESAPERGDFRVREERSGILATTAAVEEALETGGARLVDNRPLSFYLGMDTKSYVKAPGHIPGSKVLPFMHLAKGGEKGLTFRSKEQLRGYAEAMGIDPGAPVITYCNSGNVATMGWFVLHELLGNPDARAYDGSMHAWTQADRPTVTMRLE